MRLYRLHVAHFLASSSVPVSTRGAKPKLTSERVRIASLIMICTSVNVNHGASQRNQRCGRNRFYLAARMALKRKHTHVRVE